MNSIKVRTPSRIHLGQIDLNGSFDRIYGGIGLAVDKFNFTFEVNVAKELEVEGQQAEKVKKVARDYLDKIKAMGLIKDEEMVKIKVKNVIPNHIGLGSGSQMGLGLAFAINRIFNLNLELNEVAKLVDRKNSRSAIGYGAFKYGGFIVDGGRPIAEKDNSDCLPPIIAQHQLPKEWSFLLIRPKSKAGLSGKEEAEAFKNLAPMAESKVAENARLILLKILPSIKENDIKSFGEAVTKIQENVGDYFSQIQGGRYATEHSSQIVKLLLEQGARGAGQSSWGPLLYAIAANKEEALELKAKLLASFAENIQWAKVSQANNQGVRWQEI